MSAPIIFLHGWGRTSADFIGLRDSFEAGGFKTFTFDLPGFGSEPSPSISWAVRDYVRYVKQRIAAEGIEKCTIVGHSFGARIALALAASDPGLVRRLVLIGAPLARSLTFRRRLLMLASAVWRLVRWLPGAPRIQSRLEEALRKRRHSMDFLYAAEGVMRETLKKVVSEDLRPYLPRIIAPTLLIYGANDRVTPVHDNTRALSYIPQAKLEIIKGAGHMVVEKPEVVAEMIKGFITRAMDDVCSRNPKYKDQSSK